MLINKSKMIDAIHTVGIRHKWTGHESQVVNNGCFKTYQLFEYTKAWILHNAFKLTCTLVLRAVGLCSTPTQSYSYNPLSLIRTKYT